MLSHVQFFATLWTVAHQAPLSMGFFRQEYWSRLPFSPPGDLPDPGIEPVSPCIGRQILYHWATWEAPILEKKLKTLYIHIYKTKGFPGGASGKETACQGRRCERHGFNAWVGKISWRRAWQPTPVFWPGESHGQRSLGGYNPWGQKESDTTKAT